MKYFFDTEFLEGPQNEKFPISLFRKQTPNTIDLISIGVVAEDGREYYAISKDFNIDEAWNRFQKSDQHRNGRWIKEYWIRENVLRPIYNELLDRENNIMLPDYVFDRNKTTMKIQSNEYFYTHGNLKEFKTLINKHGKSNSVIAKEVHDFVMETGIDYGVGVHVYEPIEFYAYFADYDWVVFCWLFGKMIDLPTGFPMYCKDLKQILDETQERKFGLQMFNGKLANNIKKLPNYPKQENAHNALDDARWNKKLYDFLTKL